MNQICKSAPDAAKYLCGTIAAATISKSGAAFAGGHDTGDASRYTLPAHRATMGFIGSRASLSLPPVAAMRTTGPFHS